MTQGPRYAWVLTSRSTISEEDLPLAAFLNEENARTAWELEYRATQNKILGVNKKKMRFHVDPLGDYTEKETIFVDAVPLWDNIDEYLEDRRKDIPNDTEVLQ